MDFGVALLLFTFTVAVYFSYTNNIQKEEQGELNSMISDARAISSSLTLSGYPSNWDNTTVLRIGIADDQRVNTTKLKYLKQLNYQQAKTKFGTIYDYFVFFTNNKGEILNLRGICGVGSQNILVTYKIKTAYYYQDDDDSFLKDFMNETFYADIYFGNQIDQLVSNLSKYGFVVLEHPLLTGPDYSQYRPNFENYTSNGRFLMISGELAAAQGKDLVGSTFYKKSGQSISDRNSTVVNIDPYLTFDLGESIVFAQAYYIQNGSTAIGFNPIAKFNADSTNAVARWQFGNGTVYFFSDFDTAYFSSSIVNIIQEAAQSLIEGTCNPINLSNIPKQKLVRAERYLNYNSQVVKMVVYLWQ